MAGGKYGLAPYGPQSPGAIMEFDVDPSTTEVYIGDIVELVADKGIAQSAAANEDNIGVVVGFADEDGIPLPYYGYPTTSTTADTNWKALVNVDPNQIYKVRYAGSAITAADIGGSGDITVATGNSTTGLSGNYIAAISTGAATLYVLGLVPTSGNAWGADCEILVRLQEISGRNVAVAGV